MSEEVHFFICRNDKCSSDEYKPGGLVFQHESIKEDETITCPHCESQYKEINGQLFLVFHEEKVFTGSKDFNDFHDQFESCRIFFQKLVLKNISEPYFEGKKFFFSKCIINELIIEDVNISSAYYPILFSDCVIGKVSISRSTITKTSLNSYKSLWSFFGITFFNTDIHESFNIEQTKTRLIITTSEVHCPIHITKKSEIELAWIHNEKKPEINTDKGSAVSHLFEDTGRESSGSSKKIKTTEGVISGINISELYIDPELKEECILENCSIRKLKFKDGSSIQGKLLFKNCFIEDTNNEPYCFEQDLVFHRCTFNKEFTLTRSNFNQALVFEFCTFIENTIFNDLKIKDDFQISFSSFRKRLFISGNSFGNYLKFHLNTIQDEINIEDNVIARDVNFRAIQSKSNITIMHNEIEGYLFLRQINILGNLDINMLNADAITINYAFIDGSFDLGSSTLKTQLRLLRLEVNGPSTLFNNTLDGSDFKKSSFTGDFIAYSLTSRSNSFVNLIFKSSYYFHTCTFSQPTTTSQCIFEGSINWYKMIADNISFNDSIIYEELKLNSIEAKEIQYVKNIVGQDVEITSVRADDLKLDDNVVANNVKIDNSRVREIDMSENASDVLIIKNSKTEDIYIRKNQVSQKMALTFLTSRDLIFNDNTCHELLLSYSCSFDGINISECGEINSIFISGITVNNDLKISDNPFVNEIYLDNAIIKHGFEFEYNLVDNFYLKNSETSNIRCHRNHIYETNMLGSCKTNNIDYTENQILAASKISTLNSGNIELNNNNIHKKLELYALNADDLFIVGNAFNEDFLIRFPNITDLIFKDNRAQSFGIFNGNLTGISISESLIMSNMIYKVSTSRDIQLEKNTIGNFDIENVASNDIIFKENRIIRYVKFDDVAANDILIKRNKLDDMPEATGEDPAPDPDQYGIRMNKCKVEGDIEVEENHALEIIQIYYSFANILSFEDNFTRSLQVRTGKYRQLLVKNNAGIGEFYCNNVSIDKDVSFQNNVFYRQFNLLHCNIGHYLEFHGNNFKDKHIIYKNFINGPLEYTIDETKTHYVFTFSPTGFNFNYRFSLLQSNNINMFYTERRRRIDTLFGAELDIRENKLNQVNIRSVQVNSAIFFRKNDVTGSLEIGNGNLLYDEKDIIFNRTLSMTGNKINNAAFYNLCFKSSASIRSNNFRGDLIFRDTDHEDCLDLSGCFVGGTFELYKSRPWKDDGDLVLDNAFIDKRLTFNNYSPKSLSFINATFNGFEIPQEWMMRWKKLVDKNRISSAGQLSSSANPVKYLKWLWKMIRGDKKSYMFREDVLKQGLNCKENLPYNLMKDFYLEDDLVNTIPALWKDLEHSILNNYDKLVRLDQSHQRENQQQDSQLIYDHAYQIKKYIQEEFMPVYYLYDPEDELLKLIDVASSLAEAPNNYMDEETKSDFEKIKHFFTLFTGVLKGFYEHSFTHLAALDSWDKKAYNALIHQRLEEQYHVLRHIWGDNGELKEEDITYYKWMHYKNLSDMYAASFLGKFRPWIRYILYEKVFGWGVQLPRIVLSTLVMVLIFTFVYYFMFQANPDLIVHWDGAPLDGPIGFWKSIVFAIQTTFSAGLGDWAPIGSGVIKIPMTINAVLGVLFVTFLIGAYGRKMLR